MPGKTEDAKMKKILIKPSSQSKKDLNAFKKLGNSFKFSNKGRKFKK
tara:strand:+ start:387 stop:527 length:141 start_codon:yes stop_codon:yes gene_type:complete